jgi:hypothetical protein
MMKQHSMQCMYMSPMQTSKYKHPYHVAGGGMCIQQVASNTIKVLNAQDTPYFTFDAVLDMSVQQEGVFAGQLLSSPLDLVDGCQVHTKQMSFPAVV